MRFDPKLIQPDDAPLDPDGELDLPDDLLELAAQLGDDATFLAARFPAAAPLTAELVQPAAPRDVASPWLRRSTWLAWGTTSALLVLGAIGWYRSATSLQQATPVALPPVHAFVGEDMAARESSAPPGRHVEGVRSTPKTVPATLFLNGVSGPELEGLLDLWQTDGESETRISI